LNRVQRKKKNQSTINRNWSNGRRKDRKPTSGKVNQAWEEKQEGEVTS